MHYLQDLLSCFVGLTGPGLVLHLAVPVPDPYLAQTVAVQVNPVQPVELQTHSVQALIAMQEFVVEVPLTQHRALTLHLDSPLVVLSLPHLLELLSVALIPSQK